MVPIANGKQTPNSIYAAIVLKSPAINDWATVKAQKVSKREPNTERVGNILAKTNEYSQPMHIIGWGIDTELYDRSSRKLTKVDNRKNDSGS